MKSFKSFWCTIRWSILCKKSKLSNWSEVPIGLVISLPVFINQLILVVNPTAYWLKYWSSGIGSFVFSNRYKIWIPQIDNLTMFDKIQSSSLRNVSWRKPRSQNGLSKNFANFLEWRPVAKIIKFHIFSK